MLLSLFVTIVLRFEVHKNTFDTGVEALIDVVCAVGELAAEHHNLVSAILRQQNNA